jgi:hypothetical protein
MAGFLTIDVYRDPVRHTPARRRSIRAALANRPEGLRAHTINHANTGTFTLIPRHYGTCLLLAWESGDAARSAWHGPLGAALGVPVTTVSTARSPAHAPSTPKITGTAGDPPMTTSSRSPRTNRWSS